MPPFEEEEPENLRFPGKGGGRGSWDVEEPQERAPDDMVTVRCSSCRKLILEEAARCPHCGHWQSADEPAWRKPWWFWAALIFCLLAMGGFSLIVLLGGLPWRSL